MCGIAGIISSQIHHINHSRLLAMSNALSHRGPDGEGSWINPSGTTGLSHRRLSVIDRSAAAAQPLHFKTRYTIVHNGEIYNYIELADILVKKGYHFKTHSDTEIIVAAYDCWKEDCLLQFDGMFAFAIWDEQEQHLFAARDRLGEKPFFYYFDEEQFVFASEMKALWSAGIQKSINNQLLCNFLTMGYVQNPADPETTSFQNILRLPAAHWLRFDSRKNKITKSPWWQLNAEIADPAISEAAAMDKFQGLFRDSIRLRLRSDIAVGTSLSGGLDSSSILAGICSLQDVDQQLNTFSAVFPGFERDESASIQKVVKSFPVKNIQVAPDADGLLNDFEKMMYHQEEPISSSSCYAQYKVYQTASQHQVRVLLDGQGADETLAGYHKYYHWFWQELYRNNKNLLPAELKAAKGIGVTNTWGMPHKLAARFPAFTASYLEKREFKNAKNAGILRKDFANHYLVPGGNKKPVVKKLNDILYFNTSGYGLEELLRYADRNSMAHGVEIRLPFLQPALVDFVFSLPAHFKIHQGFTKWLLRKSMEKQLPGDICWRKDKLGFEPPQKIWMQHPLLQNYLQEAKIKLVNKGILNPAVLSKKNQPLDAHAADNYDWRFMVASRLL